LVVEYEETERWSRQAWTFHDFSSQANNEQTRRWRAVRDTSLYNRVGVHHNSIIYRSSLAIAVEKGVCLLIEVTMVGIALLWLEICRPTNINCMLRTGRDWERC